GMSDAPRFNQLFLWAALLAIVLIASAPSASAQTIQCNQSPAPQCGGGAQRVQLHSGDDPVRSGTGAAVRRAVSRQSDLSTERGERALYLRGQRHPLRAEHGARMRGRLSHGTELHVERGRAL